jgi:hypothetical protein
MSISRLMVAVPVLAGLVVTGSAVARMLPAESVRDSVYQTCAHNGVHFNKQGHSNCGLHKGWSQDDPATEPDQPATDPESGDTGDTAGTADSTAATSAHGKGHAKHQHVSHAGKTQHGHGAKSHGGKAHGAKSHGGGKKHG